MSMFSSSLFGEKRSKYGNKRVQFQGLNFDSIGERDRYIQLKQSMTDGEIFNLVRQARYPLTAHGVKICDYVADFAYEVVTKDHGFPEIKKVVEDFKGVMTDVFRIKAKMFKAQYGFEITISTARSRPKYSKGGLDAWKKN